ncbi:SDR family oxidoreductase [Sphingomonas ginkgonis]|uniref:SDR family oxidoreductase n=1 Tax=Sphingomonas ginkgonis TaxID=2315330 RepID=A0A3R9YK38_9SPHN|nr:SDR family oxidoreductase [Sphingomonas ginkgonis]RST31676.1 SDR family oxidoreductase [Sphingomonas ginkgonis]
MDIGTAIVTGAARRVGRVLADGLLADGWVVVAHRHRDEDEVPPNAVAVTADLAEPDCGERIVAAARAGGLPPLRLLVNNAARFAPDDLANFSFREFAAHMKTNVQAPVLLSQAFAREAFGGDRLIVNILDAKLASPNPDFLSYTLSKYAGAGLTELLARQLAGSGIRVNAIAPALMLQSAGQSAENFAVAHRHNPLKRGVEPTDVLTALRYLLDSPVLTGQTLQLDSGQRFMAPPRDVQHLEFH